MILSFSGVNMSTILTVADERFSLIKGTYHHEKHGSTGIKASGRTSIDNRALAKWVFADLLNFTIV
jgi:hypothetical protein